MQLQTHSRAILKKVSELCASVCVIIVNYNSGDYLARCLEALSRQDYSDFVTVVVDNGSGDGSLQGCRKTPANSFIVALYENVGFAAANNVVGMCVQTPWIATLNPDAVPCPDWLSKMMAATKRYHKVTMFGCTLIYDHERVRLDGTGDCYSSLGIMWRGNDCHPISDLPAEGEVFAPCAAAALYRTDVFKSVGGFDETFFCYCEDVDIAFRMRLVGNTCVQVKDAVAYHYGSWTAGRESDFSVYHGFRNRFWTFTKNMPSPLYQILLGPHLFVTFGLLLKEAAMGRGPAAWAGMRDGFRKLFGPVAHARRSIQRTRRVSVMTIARAMTWSPIKMIRRAHDVRPIKNPW